MRKEFLLPAAVSMGVIALAATFLLLVGNGQAARAKETGAEGLYRELSRRIEMLELEVAALGGSAPQDYSDELGKIASAVEDASDRWMRSIAGSLENISRELEYIRKALERSR